MTESTDPDIAGEGLRSAAQHLRSAAGRADDASVSDLRDRVAPRLPSLELGERLGEGGMGVVFRARQRDLERDVAIKVIATPPGDRAEWSARFQREARALSALEHPGIVSIHGFGESEDVAWIVMELVDGASLRALMDADALTPEEALAIAPELCAALEYAHERGIVHRDIKPENVLVDASGRVKLVDFGIAKLADDDVETRLTRTHQAMGTLRYMAPEQLDAPQRVDHRADIYALGVVLYEMLTGIVPQGVIAPPSRRVEVDVRLDEVVLRSLEREPEQRFQRVAELGERVRAIRDADGPPAPGGPSPESIRSEFWFGLRCDALVLVGYLVVAVSLDSVLGGRIAGQESFTRYAAGFAALLALAPLYAILRGPGVVGLSTSVIRFATPFLMLAFAIAWDSAYGPDRVRPGAREVELLARFKDALILFMLLPFLTAAGGTRVPRRPRWGYGTQGVLRWTGFGLCLVVLAESIPPALANLSVGAGVMVLLFSCVAVALVRPADRGGTSRGHHRRAVLLVAAGITGVVIVLGPPWSARWAGPAGGVGWSPVLAWSSLLLAILGGFAGMGSPRDAPDLPRPGAR